jgi:hypothetical protein
MQSVKKIKDCDAMGLFIVNFDYVIRFGKEQTRSFGDW